MGFRCRRMLRVLWAILVVAKKCCNECVYVVSRNCFRKKKAGNRQSFQQLFGVGKKCTRVLTADLLLEMEEKLIL